uniref:Uncharacterized protein n=1 Tax=Arundo donax TaxID=35708 RepID=A0A0A9AWY7_ARUDO
MSFAGVSKKTVRFSHEEEKFRLDSVQFHIPVMSNF